MSQSGKPKLAPKPEVQWPSLGETIPLPLALSLLGGGRGSSGGALSSDGSDKEYGGDSPPLAKRRKSSLDPMEKENRRKIRNRVASQTSRDRKKKHMEDLEKRIELLEEMVCELDGSSCREFILEWLKCAVFYESKVVA